MPRMLDVGESIEENVKMRQPSWTYGAPKNDAEQRMGTKMREVWKWVLVDDLGGLQKIFQCVLKISRYTILKMPRTSTLQTLNYFEE